MGRHVNPPGHRTTWRRWLVIGGIVLPLSAFGACYGYTSWWWAGAEAAVRATVSATAIGRSPAGIVARIDSGALRPSIDFRLPYEIEGADNELAGTSPSELLSPGVWVGHLKFPDGHVYHAEARRDEGVWAVEIGPTEGR